MSLLKGLAAYESNFDLSASAPMIAPLCSYHCCKQRGNICTYYDQLKIQNVCQSLAFTKKPVKQIAYDLTFDDQYYFSRIFSRYLGLSPV